jgi:hypothetical protein
MTDELFSIIGRLYYDLIRANTVIESLRGQQQEQQQTQSDK